MAESTHSPCSPYQHRWALLQKEAEGTPSGRKQDTQPREGASRLGLPTPDCSWSLGHTTNISPVEDRNGTRKIICSWSSWPALLGTSSGFAIGKDRVTERNSGAGTAKG